MKTLKRSDGLLALMIVPLLAFAFAALRITWFADDLVDAANVAERGVVGAVVFLYQNWSGRYAANFLAGLAKLVPTSLPTYLVLALWLVATVSIVRKLKVARVYAMVIVVATLAGISNPSEVFFWQSGLMAYGLWISSATVLFALLLYRVPLWACFGWAFFMAGLSETGTMALIVLLAIGALKTKSLHVQTSLLGAMIGAVILFIAPGNMVRSANFQRLPIFTVALNTAQGIGLPLAIFAICAPLVALVLVTWLLSVLARVSKHDKAFALAGIAIVALVFAATMFTGYFSTAGPLVPRALAIPQYVMISAALLFIATRGRYARLPRWVEPVMVAALSIVALLRVSELRVL